jgi:hypothetical protein
MPPPHLLCQFLPEAHSIHLQPLGSGNINDTYLAEARIGAPTSPVRQFVLQRLNHHIFRDPQGVMANWVSVAQHLTAQPDYPYAVPHPMPTIHGTWLHQDETGSYWRMFPFFADTEAPEGGADVLLAQEAARAYGTFAKALRHFPVETLTESLPGFHDTERRWAAFGQALEADTAGRVASVQNEIERLRATRVVTDRIAAWKASGALPLRVTHNDTKAGNVLMHRQTRRAIAVIDLDTVMPGTLLSDFGDMVRTFVPTAAEDADSPLPLRTDIYHALETAYLEETAEFITPLERDHLRTGGLWMCAEQALRFLTDYISGDVYYKIRFPEHNLRRARNQLHLFEALYSREQPFI